MALQKPSAAPPTALQLLSGVLDRIGGMADTKTMGEAVGIVKELKQMAKEERDDNARVAFGRAFYQLKKNMPALYMDKAGHNRAGEQTFVYCSEEEIAKMLEPHLMAHGFVMLTGQENKDGLVTISITLIHAENIQEPGGPCGHQETRLYTVRPGIGNSVKDNTMVDTSATTSAWRHLTQKMFGLKSRISNEQDPRDRGEYITPDQAADLEHRLTMINGDKKKFLEMADAESFATIYSASYKWVESQLRRKEVKEGGGK